MDDGRIVAGGGWAGPAVYEMLMRVLWLHRCLLQKVRTAPMVKSHQNQSGRRFPFAGGGGSFFGLAAASDWCTKCSQLCHKGCAVESHHAPQFDTGYGLGFQPVPDGSLADFGQFGGFDNVDKAVVL